MYQNICCSLTFERLELIYAALKNSVSTPQTTNGDSNTKKRVNTVQGKKSLLIYKARERTKIHCMRKMKRYNV